VCRIRHCNHLDTLEGIGRDNDRCGSNCEELTVSKSSPLYSTDRTSARRSGMSQKGQGADLPPSHSTVFSTRTRSDDGEVRPFASAVLQCIAVTRGPDARLSA